SWSNVENDSYIEIDTEEQLFGLIGCVKVENGKALLDEEKYKQQIEELNGLTELEKLKAENEELRQRVDMSDEALLELADMVLSATAAMKGGE
ncbi:hypothetical protein, partial [Enterococcus gilvus]